MNISPLFLLTLKEAKYIIQTAFKDMIPRSVLLLTQKCKDISFSSKLSRLSAMVQEYNTVQKSLTREERVLLQHRLIRIETVSLGHTNFVYDVACIHIHMYCSTQVQ